MADRNPFQPPSELGWATAGPGERLVTTLLRALSWFAGIPFCPRDTGMLPTVGCRDLGLALPTPQARPGAVVVAVPDGMRPIVRRVVAVSGDEVTSINGALRVGDRPASELGSQLPLDSTLAKPGRKTTWQVPPGHVFLLGDHVSSIDSRHFGPVPETAVIARYMPVFGWGVPHEDALDEQDWADIEHIRHGSPRARAQLDRLLAAGGFRYADVALVVYRGLEQLGEHGRAEGAATRALGQEPSSEGRAFWSLMLARSRLRQHDLPGVVGAVDVAPSATVWASDLADYRATALARMGRWGEALAAGEAFERQWPERGYSAARLAGLIGLGRFSEALERMDAISADEAWGHACWEPFHRAYLATAQGDDESAATLLVRSIEAGFHEPEYLAKAPLLARLRGSTHWRVVEDALGKGPAVHQ